MGLVSFAFLLFFSLSVQFAVTSGILFLSSTPIKIRIHFYFWQMFRRTWQIPRRSLCPTAVLLATLWRRYEDFNVKDNFCSLQFFSVPKPRRTDVVYSCPDVHGVLFILKQSKVNYRRKHCCDIYFFLIQCHHMSVWTSWSSLQGMAVV
jgi:hypothetical protein